MLVHMYINLAALYIYYVKRRNKNLQNLELALKIVGIVKYGTPISRSAHNFEIALAPAPS